MEKIKIQVSDFNVFYDMMKSTAKIVEAAKFQINTAGLAIYGTAHDGIARCEIVTNAISVSPGVPDTEFIIENMANFVKLLGTVKDAHEDDFSDLGFFYAMPFVKFESKKIKIKLTTCNEIEKVEKWFSKKITTEMESKLEFTTTSDMISRINKHAYISSDPTSMRIYLGLQDDMEKNALYASAGNRENDLNNEITLKFGLITSGSMEKGQVLILDPDRLNLFNVAASQDIKIVLTDRGILKSKVKVLGKSGSFFDITLYTSPLKN